MLLALASIALAQAPVKWYGPETVTFNVQFSGNPYDPDQNNLIVRFVPDKGPAEERIAWVDVDGSVRATLVSTNQARYRAILLRNGKQMVIEPEGGFISLKKPLPRGYIRRDAQFTNRFRWDNGEPYYPVGFNLGWQSGDILKMSDQISKMTANGVNWTRIWASNWDNKNPWWPQGDMPAIKGELWPKALVTWDELVQTCDQFDLRFQMVLFNHGSFSSTVNPNWPDHPWNKKKDGFLENAADFFTDKEAKRRTTMWLRYAVARYGHSPSLMAWELFNEVEWVDARYQNRWADIEAWHKEMAEYVRSIDPYHHLVTTSSAMDRPALWTSMDYNQPHTYPSNVTAAVAGFAMPKDKPGFFGEFGPPDQSEGALAKGVRDGIYAGMLANHAGAAQYWSWDVVEKRDLYPIFKTAALVLAESELAKHPAAKSYDLLVTTPGSATLSFGPGRGWEKADKTSFDLPAEANAKELAKLPAFLQSLTSTNKALFPEALTFRFTAARPGTFKMRVQQISKGGALVKVFVNDKEAASKAWPAAEKETNVRDVLEAAFSTGQNVIRIENTGTDWINVQGFEFGGMAPQAAAMTLAESDWAMIRLVRAPGVEGEPLITLGALPLLNGAYSLTEIDLLSGQSRKGARTIDGASIKDFKPLSADTMLILKR